MTDTPRFTLRLHAPERDAMMQLVAVGKASGRWGYTPSDAVRSALLYAVGTPERASFATLVGDPVTRGGPKGRTLGGDRGVAQ